MFCTQFQNCVDQGVPVRVVRGHESKSSYCGKVYTYDGLYKVIITSAMSIIFFGFGPIYFFHLCVSVCDF